MLQGGPSWPNTSYSNSLGSGDRTALITVTAAVGVLGSGTLNNLVDGVLGNNSSDAIGFATSFAVDSTKWILFNFGRRVRIDEAKFYQQDTTSHGTWKWQGSHDGSEFYDIGSSFTLGGATTQTMTNLSGNTGAYQYLRLLGVSGTASNVPWLQEFDFKVSI